MKKVGLHRYARHPSTDVWCLAFAFGDDEPQLWTPGQEPPPALVAHVQQGLPFYGWNVGFEYEIWTCILVPRYGFPPLAPEQLFCTMSMSFAMAMPGSLDNASYAFGVDERKDKIGHAMMLKFARPWKREPTQWMDACPKFKLGGQQWTGAEGLKYLHGYCLQDVRSERDVGRYVLPLSDRERRVWLLDQKINRRGVQLDIPTTQAAVEMAETVKAQCATRMSGLTGGAVQKVTAVAALKEWIAAQGVEGVESVAKQQVVDLLSADDDEELPFTLPPVVREVLVLRQEAGKASTAKFDVMLDVAGEDGRLRHMYQYHGAGPGRWAGRKVQTHNLPRDMPKMERIERILALVRAKDWKAIDMVYGPPLTMLSKCLRAFFVAPPGRKIVSGDWSNVEGRGQAWFAGEQWKLDAFRAADAKTGPGLYELAYSRMFNVPVESVKNPSEERQIGKVSELAFGYQGGVGSFHTMAKAYPEISGKISDQQADEFKNAWRDAHPAIAGARNERGYRKGGAWRQIEDAAIAAVMCPGEKFTCGVTERQATYLLREEMPFLWCLLPSGRAICYPHPKILEGEYGPQLTYMCQPSQDDKKKKKVIYDDANGPKWVRVATYGGSLFNNIVQGFCRDFLADCMLDLDQKGADIVLHTHDDVNIEVDDAKAEGACAAMREIMLAPPAWAPDFPLFSKPAVMQRYGKS